MKSRKYILLIAMSAMILTGCAPTFFYGHTLLRSSIDEIKKGQTTKQEIIALFRNPKESQHLPDDKEILIYESNRERQKSTFSPIIIRDTKRLTITLNSEGIVEDYKIDELTSEYISTPSSPPSQSNSLPPYRPIQYPNTR